MANRYWVGDSGNVSDTAHWSTSSGGAGGASIPDGALHGVPAGGNSATNDVFFDANSFSADGAVVTLDVALMPKSMDMSAITHTFSFSGSSAVIIQGTTLTLSNRFTGNAGAWSVYPLSSTAVAFDQAGANMNSLTSFTFSGDGQSTGGNTYNLSSDVTMTSANFFISSAFWTSATATFNSNNHNITVSRFDVLGVAPDGLTVCSAVANMGTSTLTINTALIGGTTAVGYSVTFNGGSSTVNITPIATPSTLDITHSGVSGTVTFGTINISAGAAGKQTSFITTGGTVPFSIVTLNIAASSSILFPNDATTTVSGTFTANGTSLQPITVARTGSAGAGAFTISAAVANVSYVNVNHSTASGAASPFVDTGGVDGGNNTNWLFPSGFIPQSMLL